MNKNLLDRNQLAAISIVALLTTLLSMWCLDEKISLGIMQLLKSNRSLRIASADIPDILLFLVCFGSGFMWLMYIYLTRKKSAQELQRFLQLAATTVPTTYIIKAFLQFAFGRTNTRFWLTNNVELHFNWFHGGGVGGFPSGHMAVFTAFGAAIYYFYPRLRKMTLFGLLLLAIALIGTDYHFLGDVIAGAYLGLIVTYLVLYLLIRSGARLWTERTSWQNRSRDRIEV